MVAFIRAGGGTIAHSLALGNEKTADKKGFSWRSGRFCHQIATDSRISDRRFLLRGHAVRDGAAKAGKHCIE
jgi:hypothetical protein